LSNLRRAEHAGKKTSCGCPCHLELSVKRAVRAGEELPTIDDVEAQPFLAQVKRLEEALNFVGSPLSAEESAALERARSLPDKEAVLAVEKVLDPHVLIGVNINPESRVKVARGPAPAELIQQGWRVALVRVHNEPKITPELKIESPNAAPLYKQSSGSAEPPVTVPASEVPNRWMDVRMFNSQPSTRICPAWSSSTASSKASPAMPESGKRRSASTWGRGRRMSASATR